MAPFDPALPSSNQISENQGRDAPIPQRKALEEQIDNIPRSPPAARPAAAAEELPIPWRLRPGEANTMLYVYGPKAAAFDEPPPPNPEPPEPAEEVGDALTPRQLAFCERYVERPVAALAARAAGYAASTAAKQAARLVKHPLVMRRILELRRKRHLEEAYRRETLLDKFEAIFAEAVERREFYAAIQALTMQARLARMEEAMPGFRYARRFDNGGEQLIWDAVTRLEQKLTEITVGDFPGAAAAIPAKSFAEGRAEEAAKQQGFGSAAERAAFAIRHRRKK